MLQAATPLIEVDFNNNLGVSSLVSRGSINVTGTFQGNAAYSGTVPAVNNGRGSSGVFDGTCDRVSFGNPSGINGLLSFTISGWVNFGAGQVSYAPRLLTYKGSSSGIDFLISSATTSPKLQLGVNGTLVTDTVTLPYNSWVFVAVTYDGTKSSNNVQFYVGASGRLATTGTATLNMGAVNAGTGQSLLLAGMLTSPDGQRDYMGYMDGFQLYGSSTDASGALAAADMGTIVATADCNPVSPLVEVDFNNGVGASSLVSRGSLSATGTFQGNAAFSGTVPVVNNGLGSSGVFDGNGDRVNFGNISGINGLQSFTIAGWVNFGSGQANYAPRLLTYLGSSGGIDFLISSATTSPKLQVGVNGTLATDTVTLSYNSWAFVAVTYDGTKSSNNVQFYVGNSGTLAATGTATLNMGAVNAGTGQSLLLAGKTLSDTTRDYTGLMDGFQIYGSTTDASGVLTLAQLDAVRAAADCKAATPLVEVDFNNGVGASSLVSRGSLNLTGTFQGNAAFSGTVPSVNGGGYSGVFDGTGDRVNFGNISAMNGARSFTIAGWVNFGSGQVSGAPRLVSYKNNNAGIDFLISAAQTSPKLQLGVDATLVTDTATLSYNSWTFVAVSYDGTKTSNNVQFYVGNSGTLAATGTATLNMGAIDVDAGQSLLLAGIVTSPDYQRDYKGYMDGFQIYASAADETGVLSFAQLNDIRATADCATGTWRSAYDLYNPTVQLSTVYNARSHDSTIVYFDNTWIAQWDDGTEAVGQKIRQSTSTDLVNWSAPIEVYSGTGSAAGSTNPISDNEQWQPSLVVSGTTLWSVFMGQNSVWFSTLTSGSGKWTNRALYGSGSQYPWPVFNGHTWEIFPGNNGLVLQSGRVLVPVTLQCWTSGTDFMSELKQDAVLSTDDGGATWSYSTGVTFGDGTQCWEATVWQPDSTVVNMIARNNRNGTSFYPDENLKYTASTDGGATWASEALLGSLEAAMSRPHVIRKGARNLLAQNDWSAITDSSGNRRNLSLFFSRGSRNDDFVAGLNFTAAEGPVATTKMDYPQVTTNGTTGVVIYTKYSNPNDWSTSITRVAQISPLPDDSKYYLFPRQARNPVDAVSVDGRSAARFHDDFSSAGIDIDANTSANSLYATFAVKPETSGQQFLFDLSNGVSLFSENGRLIMQKWSGGVVEVDCGPLPVGVWSTVDFIANPSSNTSWARSNGGIYNSVPVAPYPWTAYFGNHAYMGLTPYSGQTFLIDLASINVMVK